MKPATRAEALIIPIRKALLDIELTVSNKLVFKPETAQHQFTIASADYNELILLPSLLRKLASLRLVSINYHVYKTWFEFGLKGRTQQNPERLC